MKHRARSASGEVRKFLGEAVPELDEKTKARIRAEEVERLRVRAELAAEQKQARIRSESRGCFGAVNLFLKVMGW